MLQAKLSLPDYDTHSIQKTVGGGVSYAFIGAEARQAPVLCKRH